MTENFELEDGSGTILLENGTDNYRLDFPIIVKDESVGVVESSNKQIIIIKNIASTIGLTGVINKFAGFVKTATQYIVTPEETKIELVNVGQTGNYGEGTEIAVYGTD